MSDEFVVTCPACDYTAPFGHFVDEPDQGCGHCETDLDSLRNLARETRVEVGP